MITQTTTPADRGYMNPGSSTAETINLDTESPTEVITVRGVYILHNKSSYLILILKNKRLFLPINTVKR